MDWKKNTKIFVVLTALSTTAYAFPWDIDLVDSPMVRGYEVPMGTPPADSISNHYRPFNYDNLDPDFVAKDMAATGGKMALQELLNQEKENIKATDPYEDPTDYAMLTNGEVMFRTYCQTCHGAKGVGKTKFGDQWPLSDPSKNRFVGIPNLHTLNSSTGMISAGTGFYFEEEKLYLYIRNGAGKMPSYAHAMSNDETWAVVHYVRSLKDTKFSN
jgi:mono/diheme cytochrome c family protein